MRLGQRDEVRQVFTQDASYCGRVPAVSCGCVFRWMLQWVVLQRVGDIPHGCTPGGTNSHHYFVATQDAEFRATLREIPGTPLLLFNRQVLVLDKLSDTSLQLASKVMVPVPPFVLCARG